MSDHAAERRWWQRFGTVRSRLTLLATAVVAAVLATSAVGLVTVQQRLLTRGVDEALVQRADNIEADVARGSLGSVLPGESDAEDSFLQLIGANGRVLAASVNVLSMPTAVPPLPEGSAERFADVSDLPLSTHEFRVLARPVSTSAGDRTLVVAKNLDDVNESVAVLARSLGLAIPAVALLLAALVWWLTGRALRPVERIRSEVSAIQGSDLRRRVSVDEGSADEISRLARTMNAMLERVQAASERQRQFVADASHELRSPLTRLRAELEVSLAHPDAADARGIYASLLADTAQLQQLVDDLLFLARSEEGASGRPDVAVDLDDLVLAEAQRLRERARVTVDVTGVSAARVLGEPNQLARAIGNLASNAERHARNTVRFELGEYDGQSVLAITDDGEGIPPDQREAVFMRFTRLDSARTRDAGGAGLGLAIVHDIVARHDGTIAVDTADGGGARFVLTLPRAD